MPKVLISDKLSPAAVQIFKDRGIETDVKTGLAPDELKAIIGQYDGLAIRSNTKVTADILAAATNLKVVGRAGISLRETRGQRRLLARTHEGCSETGQDVPDLAHVRPRMAGRTVSCRSFALRASTRSVIGRC